MTTEDIDEAQGSSIQAVMTKVREIDAGGLDLVHVAHRRGGGHLATTVVVTADALGRDQRLVQGEEGGGRWKRNRKKASGTVIEIRVPAKRRAAALKRSQRIRTREEVIVGGKEGELLLNRRRGTIFLAFLR
jgi:hypothetical protein